MSYLPPVSCRHSKSFPSTLPVAGLLHRIVTCKTVMPVTIWALLVVLCSEVAWKGISENCGPDKHSHGSGGFNIAVCLRRDRGFRRRTSTMPCIRLCSSASVRQGFLLASLPTGVFLSMSRRVKGSATAILYTPHELHCPMHRRQTLGQHIRPTEG